MSCLFCDRVLMGLDPGACVHYFGDAPRFASFYDRYPSAPGHRLIVPIRHISRAADLGEREWAELWECARAEMLDLSRRRDEPDGFTVGINDGAAAGQTVPHLHLHIIPRTAGDTAEPRGGIRWAVPETAPYWDQS